MEIIRIATPEEIESIKAQADLTPTSTVFAMSDDHNQPIIGVLRQVTELDPVFFPENCPTPRKVKFMWGIETGLRMLGVKDYYFNVLASPDQQVWLDVLQKAGAELTSKAPEYRLKKVL